jgi:soluble cytochrome b562
MIKRNIRIVAAMLLAVFVSAGIASAEEKHSALEESMETMNKALKTLRMQLADPGKNASSLELVAEMQKQALISKGLVPARAAKIPAGDRPKFLTAYRHAMVGLMSELLKLETALIEGKNDQADAIAKGLNKVKADGHEKFQEE